MSANNITITLGGAIELLLRPALTGQVFITTRFGAFTAKGSDMAYTLPSAMEVEVQVSYVDAAGHPAVVDGEVTWASSAENVANVTVDTTDSTKAMIAATADLGTAQITATADADLGLGVRELITMMDVTVVAGEAVAGTISPTGEAQPQ